MSTDQTRQLINELHRALEHEGFVPQARFFADGCLNHGRPVTRQAVR